MTPAEHLSAAATRLRELANAASGGERRHVVGADGFHYLTDADDRVVAEVMTRRDAAYMEAMDPPLALALADWLEHESTAYDYMGTVEELLTAPALALAALIVPATAEVKS